MARQVRHDAYFGPLEWDRLESAWVTSTDFAPFADSGGEIPHAGAREERARPRRHAFGLVIVSGSDDQPPTPDQRQAWQLVLDSRERLAAHILQQAFAMYQRQRDLRVYWWQEIYGADDPLLPRVRPTVASAAELLPLIRPLKFIIHRDWLNDGHPVIGIEFDAAWDARGFGIRVRDGAVVELGNEEVATNPPRDEKLIEHPVFGPMREMGDEWEGSFRWAPLQRFHAIFHAPGAPTKDSPGDLRGFTPRWDFIEGRFDLAVAVDEDTGPSDEAIAAFRAFTADPQRSAEQVLAAIAAFYDRVFDIYHRPDLDPDYINGVMPPIHSIDDLRTLLTFQSLHVFRSIETGEMSIGLGFECTWEEEHGLGIRWRNGIIEDIGMGEVAFT